MEENNSNSKITLQKNSISFKSRIWRNMYQSLKCFKYHHLGGALETKRYVNVFIHFKAPTTHTHTHVACTHSHTPHTYPLMPTDTLNLINNMKLHVNRTNTKKARKIEKGRNKSPLKHFSGLKKCMGFCFPKNMVNFIKNNSINFWRVKWQRSTTLRKSVYDLFKVPKCYLYQ